MAGANLWNTPEHRERKPRQVFKKVKDYRKFNLKNKIESNSPSHPSSIFQYNKKAHRLIKSVAALAVSAIIAIAFFAIKNSRENKRQVEVAQKEHFKKYMESHHKNEMAHHYKTLIQSAHSNLKYGREKHAAHDFIYALKIEPYGYEAAIGLTESLMKDCMKFNSNCEPAEKWVIFCKNAFGEIEKVKIWKRQLHQKQHF